MLTIIIGWFWVIIGVFFLIKPQALQKKLQRKGSKRIKKTLFFLTLALSVTLILATIKHQGVLPKVIMIVGIIGLLKAFILLKSKASDKLIAWSANQPLILYRVGGVAYIAVGVALIKFL